MLPGTLLPSIIQYLHYFIYLFIYLLIYLFIYLHIYLFIYLLIYLFFYLSTSVLTAAEIMDRIGLQEEQFKKKCVYQIFTQF